MHENVRAASRKHSNSSSPVLHRIGGPRGIEQKASKEIARHQFDDTFYIVDLGNTTRLFKVGLLSSKAATSIKETHELRQ